MPPAPVPEPPTGRALTLRRRVAFAVLGGLVLAAAALVVLLRGTADPPARAADATALAETLDRVLDRRQRPLDPGILIRPLAFDPGDLAAAAQAGVVCDALARRLARLPGLRVATCASTQVALAADLDDSALARLLDARWIVVGALRAAGGGRLHVQVALREPGGGHAAWAVDEPLAPAALQALSERAAQAVAQLLGRTVPPVETQVLADTDYARFVRASALARRPVIDDLREAYRLVEEVLAAAPEHVPSLYLRQSLRPRLDGFLGGGPGEQGDPERIAAAQAQIMRDAGALGERLAGRDPGDARARLMLATAAISARDWAEAFAQVDALVAAGPLQPGVLRSAAKLHLMAGYVERARALAFEAVRVDALDATSVEYLATTQGMQGRDEAMRELLTIAAQVGHGGNDLFEAILARRRADWPAFERAMAAYARNTDRDAGWVPAYARGAADPGQRESAAQLLDAHEPGLRFYMSDYFVEYALLGDTARSLAAIRRHAKQPPKLWLEYLWWPELAAVRRDAGFVEAMADLGLPALWERRGSPDLCARGADGHWTCR